MNRRIVSDRLIEAQETLLDCSKWLRRDLNLRPWAYESPALTTELLSRVASISLNRFRFIKLA
jgi:hypothetical protein